MIFAFDLNETVLDLSALDGVFSNYFGSPLVRQEWFQEVLKLAFATTIIGTYYNFTQIGEAALKVIEHRYARHLDRSEQDEILQGMRSLPAYADVPNALHRLKREKHTVVALTNGTGEVAEMQLRNAKIWEHFDHIFTADAVQRLKPAPEPYRFVARTLNCDLADIVLVAAHAWDCAGAIGAGCEAAFVARPGHYLNPLVPEVRYRVSNLTELADAVVGAQAA
jgi:2-haloacid dehalogenase